MKLYREKNLFIRLGLICGIAGMFLWVIPTISIIINLIAIACGIISVDVRGNVVSKAILILGILGFVITLLRTGLVFFLT